MTAQSCPHCGRDLGSDLGSRKGEEIGSGSALSLLPDPNPISSEPPIRGRARGKNRTYSGAFEVAWKAYGRREEKMRAFGEWLVAAHSVGGETSLLPLILGSLAWQAPIWADEGWKFAPYFERYLKRRKWEDEPPAPPVRRPVPPRVVESFEEARQRSQRERMAADRQRVAQAEAEAQKLLRTLAEAKS